MTQEIYFSKALNTTKGGSEVITKLKNTKEINLLEFDSESPNPWCRDYMPVKNAKGDFVLFKYWPAYMNLTKDEPYTKYKNWHPDIQNIWSKIGPENKELKIVDIILDGGNVELHGNKAIISDRIFRDNDELKMKALYDDIKKILAVDQLIIVPQHPEDFTGHVDGLIRFIDSTTVLIQDTLYKDLKYYQELKTPLAIKYKNWYYAFISALLNAGLKIEELKVPNITNSSTSSAEGIYLNFFKGTEVILMPSFNNEMAEEEIMNELKRLFKMNVIAIPAKELSRLGGVINCVTWSFE